MKQLSLLGWRPGRRFVIGLPYAWLVVFFVVPFLILLRISVTDMGSGIDPFAPLVDTASGAWRLLLKYDNYLSIFRNTDEGAGALWGQTVYLDAYKISLKYAFFTTLLCLVIGYPFAYFLARAKPSRRPALLMLVMLPFWTSFLLRVYAWKGILADQGVLNNLLLWMGVIQEPMVMLYTDVSGRWSAKTWGQSSPWIPTKPPSRRPRWMPARIGSTMCGGCAPIRAWQKWLPAAARRWF